MLQRTHVTRASSRHGASTLSPARRWTEPAAGSAAPAAGGHDLSRISVSTPAASTPIQRVKWTWDASKSAWDEAGGSTGATPPTHVEAADGMEYDDEYSQADDPTATPYHKSGAEYFGERGTELQEAGREPSADEIREPAVGGSDRIGGAGLHEAVPTSLRGFVARSRNKALRGTQNGLRTSTDYQLFSPKATDTGEVGGHTGFFRKPGSSGSTHTRGQAPAHDTLRDAAYEVENEADRDVVVNKLTLAHIDSVPTGQEVLQSEYITGALPNLTSFGVVGAVSDPPDPARLKLAQDVHARRELVKARERGRARDRDPGRTRLRSPSPERTPIDASGKGGEYVQGDRTTWSTAPVPRFKGKGWRNIANETAWLSQPQRHGFDVSNAPLVRPVASVPTPPSAPVTVSPPVVTPPTGKGKRKRAILPPVTASPTPVATPAPSPRGRSAKRARVTPAPVVVPAPTTPSAPKKRGRPPKRKRQTPSPTPAATSSRSRKARSPASPPPKRAKNQANASPSQRRSLPRRAKKGPP